MGIAACNCNYIDTDTCNACTNKGREAFLRMRAEITKKRILEIDERIAELQAEKNKLESVFKDSEKTKKED